MPFYKRNDPDLTTARDFVKGPKVDLVAARHTEYTYPVDGWWWFDTLQEAMAALLNPVVEKTLQDLTVIEVQKLLDDTARVRGYGDDKTAPSVSIVTYLDDKNPKFAADAADFKTWRSDVWTTCYRLLAEVQAGTLAMPVSPTEILPMLPAIVWTT